MSVNRGKVQTLESTQKRLNRDLTILRKPQREHEKLVIRQPSRGTGITAGIYLQPTKNLPASTVLVDSGEGQGESEVTANL